MLSGVPHSFESRWYRTALWLCPPVFRREHGDEMSRDFDDLRGEAAARGSGALWALRFFMTIDLVRTAGMQWLRTGLPVIALVSISVQLVVAEGLAKIVRVARIPMPDNVVHSEADVLAVLLVSVTLLLIAMTIALNLWVTRLNRRRLRGLGRR